MNCVLESALIGQYIELHVVVLIKCTVSPAQQYYVAPYRRLLKFKARHNVDRSFSALNTEFILVPRFS